MRKHLFKLLVILLYCVNAQAQQDPIYSQYMFNGLVINPAYASMDDASSITVVGRNQWVGIDGAPKTATVSFYTPINESGTSLGFSAMHEKITVQSRTDMNAHASQKINLSDNVQLSMGLLAGMSQYKENNSELTSTDPAFANNQQYWKTNVGFGFMLFAENFYVGLSAPNFKSFDLGKSLNRVVTKSHYYLQGGYFYYINDDVQLKPGVLLRYLAGNGLQYDINTSVLLKEVVWLGVSWRSEKTVTGLVQVRLTNNLELGYSYDTPTVSNLKGAQSVSHELMLNFRFGWGDRTIEPRHF